MTLQVRVHDIYTDGINANTGQAMYAAILICDAVDLRYPLAFHTGYLSGQYLSDMRKLRDSGTVTIEVDEKGFFDSDLYHQRKEVVRSAFLAAGMPWD